MGGRRATGDARLLEGQAGQDGTAGISYLDVSLFTLRVLV